MDIQSCFMLCIGCAGWMTTIVIEASIDGGFITPFMPPCDTEKRYSSYNLVFIAFPIMLITLAEMRLCWSLGALGLTNILELFCLLGLSAYDKIIQFHSPFCVVAGLCHFCVCLNVAWWCGIFSGAPLLILSFLYILYGLDKKGNSLAKDCDTTICLLSVNTDNPEDMHDSLVLTEVEDSNNSFIISAIIWLQDIWLILSRLVLIFADPIQPSIFFGGLGHGELDVLCFGFLSLILLLYCSFILYNQSLLR